MKLNHPLTGKNKVYSRPMVIISERFYLVYFLFKFHFYAGSGESNLLQVEFL